MKAVIETELTSSNRARVITEFAENGVTVLPELLAALEHPDARVRTTIAEVGEIGPDARNAVPQLIQEARRAWDLRQQESVDATGITYRDRTGAHEETHSLLSMPLLEKFKRNSCRLIRIHLAGKLPSTETVELSFLLANLRKTRTSGCAASKR